MTADIPDGMTESDTDRDGVLSYAGEYHALAIGAFLGVAVGLTGDTTVLMAAVAIVLGKAKYSNPHLKDATQEVAYTASGFVVTLPMAAGLRASGVV